MDAHRKVRSQLDQLKADFDTAHDHIVRLEEEKTAWLEREAAISDVAADQENQFARLTDDNAKLTANIKELRSRLSEREEDVERVKQRLASETRDLGARIAAETKAKEEAQSRADALVVELRRIKERVNDLAQTTVDREEFVRRQEAVMADLQTRLATVTQERDGSAKQASELGLRLESLSDQVSEARTEREALVEARAKVQRDLDELRSLMAAKRSEEEAFAEVRRQQDEEMVRLRQQASRLAEDLSSAKREAAKEHVRLGAKVKRLPPPSWSGSLGIYTNHLGVWLRSKLRERKPRARRPL
jgi:myosin protein heavy chain